jgi:hypothetical protein
MLFAADGEVYDPIAQAIPEDVTIGVVRGDSLSGSVILNPISYLNTHATPDTSIYIEKTNNSEFIFHYKVPEGIFPGPYTIIAKTVKSGLPLVIETRFQVKETIYEPNPTVVTGNKSSVISYKPTYQDLSSSNTSSILLIGHADRLQINNPIKIKSIQSAIDLLGANTNSPLLRGVLDAYDAGARDIFICAAAPMSEYIADVDQRNTQYNYFNLGDATPSYQTFYEKYYQRLEETYSVIKTLDFIDIVVPLEASIIRTGSVDFITQLANYCSDFHDETGYVQIGIIGSRTNGLNSSDISTIESNNILKNKFTTYSYSGEISSDKGRYIVPVYGEATFSHSFFQTTYTNSVVAAVAGMIASTQLNIGLIRKRIPGAMALYGSEFTNQEVNRLESIGINTIYKSNKARRGTPFQVYLSNDYTMSDMTSVFSKLPQLRLAGLLASEVKNASYKAIGRFNYDKVVSDISNILINLKNNQIISNFEFKAVPSQTNKGVIILYINVISSLGLKKISLSLSAGPGA